MTTPRKTRPLRPVSFALGLIVATLALFMSQATLRQICVAVHKGDYVRDEFELEYFSDGPGRGHNSLGGHVVSTGEHFSTAMYPMPLEKLRELAGQMKLEGHRTPVWYLPRAATWGWTQFIFSHRLLSPSEFELSGMFRLNIVLFNLTMAALSLWLIRRGLYCNRARKSVETNQRPGSSSSGGAIP
ncbi:MAG: hypothetical protein IPK83_21800 [Planctomycetes bacterium]|nr:hypothetical protein [Planctomycetota bacterium]